MREQLRQLLKDLYIIAGIDQLGKLTDVQVSKLLDELVIECGRPEWPMTDKAKINILIEGIKNADDFFGLNVKFVRKVFNAHMKMHPAQEKQHVEQVDLVSGYRFSIAFWQEHTDLDPDGLFLLRAQENLELVLKGDQPINDEMTAASIKVLQNAYMKQIAGSSLDVSPTSEPITAGQRLKKSLGL